MSGSLTLREIARALGGEVQGRQVLAPGPGHSRADRSLSVRLSHQSTSGWIVHTFSGHDFKEARDFVAEKLALGPDTWKRRRHPSLDNVQDRAPVRPEGNRDNTTVSKDDNIDRISRARAIWDAAGHASGSLVEVYLAGRGLSLDLLDNVHEVIRFHRACAWRDEEADRTVHVPCMVSALRSIQGDEVTGIHRTRLGPDGTKLGRRMLGIARAAAIKLDADADVTMGLAIGEGIESCLAARAFGLRPVWALGSASAIASFPVTAGIEALTILAENDAASASAVEACAARWAAAGAEVSIIRSTRGNDLNDALKPEVA